MLYRVTGPSSVVPGWPVAFRGSAAVAAGVVTRDRLRGPHFLGLFPDTYVTAPDKPPPELALRSLAAFRYVQGKGFLSGYSAAELLGASCAPGDAPAEVTVPGGGQRTHAGLLVHRDRLAPGELRRVGDVTVTAAVRTAYDLARWHDDDPIEAVVAVDTLADQCRFAPDLLLHYAAHYPRARGNAGIARTVSLADRRSGSPMETRLRMVIVLAGLPTPDVQHVVQDERTRTAIWLDLAYPERRIGIEYAGEGDTSQEAVLRDAGRYTRLVDQGWRIYR